MKKSFFLSILAVGALLAGCAKSEVVDSKYGNNEIGFTTYLGRDAQTKAKDIERADLEEVKVYGYYHGLSNWANSKESLLWTNGLTLTTTASGVNALAATDVRYWANESDKYTFLAYAPVAGLSEAEGTFTTSNPVLTYTVDNTSFTNGDVLVADPQIDRTRDKLADSETAQNGVVDLQLKHKLARLVVNATAASEAFDFRIKEVTLAGKFYTSGTIDIAAPTAWAATAPTENVSFSFFDLDEDNEVALDETETNVIGSKGYMMMIPVTSSVHAATLTVKYTTWDPNAGQESAIYTQTFNVTQDFAMGSAYKITLAFENDAQAITFDVDVEPWGDENEVAKTENTQN